MEIIELTKQNIDQYLNDCVELQSYLVKPEEKIDAKQFIATAAHESSYMIGVLLGEKVVGLGVINKFVHPVRTAAYVDNIVVHPEARGGGLFTALMDNLEEKAKDWGVTQVMLTCSREGVQGMYEKRNYSEKNTKFYVKNI